MDCHYCLLPAGFLFERSAGKLAKLAAGRNTA